jgi:hypothetical protein
MVPTMKIRLQIHVTLNDIEKDTVSRKLNTRLLPQNTDY